MEALQEAHQRGLRTFGMLCPLLPGIADTPEQIGELVAFLEGCGVDEDRIRSDDAGVVWL